MSTAETPTSYWAAFSHRNHVIAEGTRPDRLGKIAALCRVLTPPDAITDPDGRPTCTWCKEQARNGHHRITPRQKGRGPFGFKWAGNVFCHCPDTTKIPGKHSNQATIPRNDVTQLTGSGG